MDTSADKVEWTTAEAKILQYVNRKPDRGAVQVTSSPRSREAKPIEKLSSAIDEVNHSQTVKERKYAAGISRLEGKGGLGLRRSAWEEKNKMDDQTFLLANTMGDCLMSTISKLQRLRDDFRVCMANVQLYGASKFPTDEVLNPLFTGTSEVLNALSAGFSNFMPLFSSSVMLNEPLRTLRDVHLALQRENELPLKCPAGEFIERWKSTVTERLRAADSTPKSRAPLPTPNASSITDKTPLAFELLMSPRSLLPTPPVFRPATVASATSRSTGRMVKAFDQAKDAMHAKYHITSLNPPPPHLIPTPVIICTTLSTPRRLNKRKITVCGKKEPSQADSTEAKNSLPVSQDAAVVAEGPNGSTGPKTTEFLAKSETGHEADTLCTDAALADIGPPELGQAPPVESSPVSHETE